MMSLLELIFVILSFIFCCYNASTIDKAVCAKPPQMQNAELQGNWSNETYPSGTTANYACRPGFIMSYKKVCLEGKWELLHNRQCKTVCAKPPQMQNAELQGNWSNETYPSGTTANYACRPGFIMPYKKVCLEGKWELLHNRQCKKKPCGHPGDIPFGTFELKNEEEFVFGAVVEYTCDEGYQMMNKHRTRTCAATGWTYLPPHCEPLICPPLKDDSIKVLSTVYDDVYTVGEIVKFECKNPKYKLQGPDLIFCTLNGTWDMEPPTCKESKSCGQPPTILYGEILRNISMAYAYHSGSSVKYQCPTLYKLEGRQRIKCLDGVWQNPPVCLAPCTAKENDMRDNNITVIWKGNKKLCTRHEIRRKYARKCYIMHGYAFEFTCLRGYKISDPSSLKTKCNNGVLQYPKCFKTGRK